MKDKLRLADAQMSDPPLGTFYRVLYTPGHYDRWRRGELTSSHRTAPPDWELRFKETGGSLSEADYDRKHTIFGEMTPRALRMWLELKGRGTNAQTDEERFASGEVPGVCAFRTPQEALAFDTSRSDDPMVRFVAFRGRYVGPCTPEESQGGVVATVEEILCSPLLRSHFTRRYLDRRM